MPRRDAARRISIARGARRLGMLDHDDGVGAARHRPAGRDRRRRSRQHRPRRRGAAGDHFVVEHEGGPARLRRPQRDRRSAPQSHRHWSDRTAARRSAPRHPAASAQPSASASGRGSLGSGARKQRSLEPRQRIFARQDGQELVLVDAGAAFRQGRAGHFGTHVSPATYRHRPAVPAANPSLPPGTASQASARAMACSDQLADRERQPAAFVSVEQHDFGNADAGCDLARQRQRDRPPRRAVRTIGRAPAAPASTTPPAPDPAAPGSAMTGILPIRPSAEVRPGCMRDAHAR